MSSAATDSKDLPVEQADAFLLDQITIAQRSLIPSTLKIAYEAAALLAKNEPILNVPSAVDNRGRLIQWSVDNQFEMLCKTGKWPFEPRWRVFERPTGRYLEIRPSHSVLTISQVADPSKQPRDVLFRANKRLNGQLSLFGKDDSDAGIPHILMLHGHQSLNFAHLGIPHEVHAAGFHHKTTNLLNMPHAVNQPEPRSKIRITKR
jgi:hypothetical protein